MQLKITQQRQQQLLQSLPNKSAILFIAANSAIRNNDVHYPYRQNSNIIHVVDCHESNIAFCAKLASSGELVTHLGCRPANPAMEAWVGSWTTPEQAPTKYAVSSGFELNSLKEFLIKFLADVEFLWVDINNFNPALVEGIKHLTLQDVNPILAKYRIYKDDLAVENIQQAVDISVKAHLHIMQACQLNWTENHVDAEFYKISKINGATALAYPTIAAGGANACVLHYIDNNQAINDGAMVLLDAGAEYNGYAADITRTFPLNGKFTTQQKDLYEVVLAAQMQAIANIKPGVTWEDLTNIASKELLGGCLALGVFNTKANKLSNAELIKIVFPHGLGHHLGLDVHDVFPEDKVLRQGHVVTIEPGLYCSNLEYINSAWHGMGIRVEDDVRVTKNGVEVLSNKLPKTVTEIELLMER